MAAMIDGFCYSICSLNTIFDVLFYILSKQFSESVHHVGFMLHEGMSIAI